MLLQGKASWTHSLPKKLEVFAKISDLQFVADAFVAVANCEIKPTIISFGVGVVLKQ